MLAALLRPLFNAEDAVHARALVGEALERLRKPLPKVAALLEEAEEDVLAFYAFPADHWAKLRSTNPLERVNREIGPRTDVVGIFPNDKALIRLAASVVIEQNDEWLVGRRYLSAHSLETVLDREKEENDPEEVLALTAARAADDVDELHHVLGLDWARPPVVPLVAQCPARRTTQRNPRCPVDSLGNFAVHRESRRITHRSAPLLQQATMNSPHREPTLGSRAKTSCSISADRAAEVRSGTAASSRCPRARRCGSARRTGLAR